VKFSHLRIAEKMNEQRYIVRLYTSGNEVIDAVLPARDEVSAIGRAMLDQDISSASRAMAGKLVLYGVRIDGETFEWDSAIWK
jgi:uncharacterized membrane protein